MNKHNKVDVQAGWHVGEDEGVVQSKSIKKRSIMKHADRRDREGKVIKGYVRLKG